MQSGSIEIFLLPLGPFDIICFDVNHKYIGCVYKNQTNSFKLPRNGFPYSSFGWKIILGGWSATKSIIEAVNPTSLCTTKTHSRNDFNTLKENFEVIVADGSITVQNHENGEIFLKCSNEEISKANLSHMSAYSDVNGELQIDKIKGLPPVLCGVLYLHGSFVRTRFKYVLLSTHYDS